MTPRLPCLLEDDIVHQRKRSKAGILSFPPAAGKVTHGLSGTAVQSTLYSVLNLTK